MLAFLRVGAERVILRRTAPLLQRVNRIAPEKAYVRILSGSDVPDGLRGWLAAPGASHRARALAGEIR